MKTEHADGQVASTLHAVIIPFPAQGHITPCLQLAKKLVGLGFRITFVNTIHNQERMTKSRSKNLEPDEDIEFVTVSDGLPESHPRKEELFAFMDALEDMGPAFEELFVSLLRASPITCVIRDALFTVSQGVAKKLGIPVVCFATPSAIALQCLYNIPTFLANGVLPLPSPPCHVPNPPDLWLTPGPPLSNEEAAHRQAPLTCLPGASLTMRVEDLPTLILIRDLNSYFFRFYREKQIPLMHDCECILLNTFYDLEGDVLDAMSGMISNVYAIGPLVINSGSVAGVEEPSLVEAGSALWEVDSTSLLWLNDQKPNSVLFVSFGSFATVSREGMQELACGLEMSGHTFLWVIRPGLIEHLITNEEFRTMFSEFVTRTKDRALLVPWVPQTAVLSHPSVAAFLTHCGWNSILESICSGVPMLGWPRISDQITNCHYIAHVWKIGLDLKIQAKPNGIEIVSKEELAQKVRKIMAEDETDLEVDKLRTNHRNLQIAATKAVGKGGLSQAGLMKFVEQMHSLQAKHY